MSEVEVKSDQPNNLNQLMNELSQVKECFHVIKSSIEEGMHNQLGGENELQMKMLLAIQLERYFGNVARELTERAEIRLSLLGMSKTGVKKRIISMQEIAKQFQM